MIGNGSTERRDEGLSDFGVAIVARMNSVGMAADVSDCGDQTTLDAFDASQSWSSCMGILPRAPQLHLCCKNLMNDFRRWRRGA